MEFPGKNIEVGSLSLLLGEGNGTHSSTLAWKIPCMEEPGRLQSMGSLRVEHDWATSLSLFTFLHWRRKWQPTPVFLSGESQGRGSLGGLLFMGSHRVGYDWSYLAVAAAAAYSFSRASSWPRIQTEDLLQAGSFFTSWDTSEAFLHIACNQF